MTGETNCCFFAMVEDMETGYHSNLLRMCITACTVPLTSKFTVPRGHITSNHELLNRECYAMR